MVSKYDRLFRKINYVGYGVFNDIRSRIPYYYSDITDSWNYRVIPSTVFIFFTNLLPAIAFAQDMIDHTNNLYGVNEVLLSSATAGVMFGLLSGQPLCIVGVTGPISIFNYTVYQLIEPRGTPYFPFMCWVYLWSMVMHLFLALGNFVSFLSIISLFSCQVFGFFICVVYIQKGILILGNQFKDDIVGGFCSVVVSILMTVFGVGSVLFGTTTHYFKPWIRHIFSDYGVPLAVVFFTGFIHFGGYLDTVTLKKLPVTNSFEPSMTGSGRPYGWFIHFWPPVNISISDMFLALPFSLLLTFLFYFDHNVSSLMCQLKQFPLTKPSSFHWDFALLGIMTGIAGILGIPAPNGLIPQAPLHTESLVLRDHRTGRAKAVVEQRLTNSLQGALTFVMMSPPFLIILGLIPQAILAGLFFIMGLTGLHNNEITNKIRFLFMDSDYIDNDPTCPSIFKELRAIENKKWFYIYLILQVIAAACEVAITMTKGAVGFPGVLLFFAICAKWFWPKFIPPDELNYLDPEVADEVVVRNLKIVTDMKKPEKAKIFNIDEDTSSLKYS